MDPSPKSHPILSYVMSRIPSMGPRYSLPVTVTNSSPSPSPLPLPSDLVEISIDQPSSSSHHASRPPPQIVDQMPHLAHPKLFASMANAVTNVAHTRAILKTLGQRPDHEAVDEARTKLAEIEFALSKKLEEIVLSPRPSSVDRLEWRAHLAEKERQCREEAEKDKTYFKGILALEEIHDAYAKMLKEAEEKLVNMYETATIHDTDPVIPEEVNEDVVEVLNQGLASGELQRVDLSGRRLRILPEPFGKIHSLVVLNLSKNQLEVGS